MKKSILVSSLLCLTWSLAGCQIQYNDPYSYLKNCKFEDINNCSAIGYGHLNNDNNKKKLDRKTIKKSNDNVVAKKTNLRQSSETIRSNLMFSLLGQINKNVEMVKVTDGNNYNNIYVREFMDIGDFIAFDPEDPAYLTHENYGINTVFELKNNFNTSFFCRYLLSKKTGKIYQIFNDEKKFDGMKPVVFNGKLLLREHDGIIYEVIEENETLKFYPSKLGNLIYNDGYTLLTLDEYDNILLNKSGFIDKNYEFHKYKNLNFYSKDCSLFFTDNKLYHYSDNKKDMYVLNDDAKLVKTDTYSKQLYYGTGLSYDSSKTNLTKEEYLDKVIEEYYGINFFSFAEFGSNYMRIYKDSYETYRYKGVNFCYYKNDILFTLGAYVSEDNVIFEDGNTRWISCGGYPHKYIYDYDKNIYIKDDYKYCRIQKNSYDGYYWLLVSEEYDDINLTINNYLAENVYSTIQRGSSVYWFDTSENVVRKLDMLNDTITNLNFEYTVNGLDVENGLIKVIGVDNNLNEFEGYLEEDDSISFEKREITEYEVLEMYPIN